MPPLDGPRAMLCVTRKPSKVVIEPSSIRVGTDTDTAFLALDRTLMRFGSMPNVSPTSFSCCCASAKGFSRRWEAGASTVGTAAPCSFAMGVRLFHCEADGAPCGLAAGGGPREEPELVAACAQTRAVGPSAREPECVLPRQHVAQSGEQPERLSVLVVQEDVEPTDGL